MPMLPDNYSAQVRKSTWQFLRKADMVEGSAENFELTMINSDNSIIIIVIKGFTRSIVHNNNFNSQLI